MGWFGNKENIRQFMNTSRNKSDIYFYRKPICKYRDSSYQSCHSAITWKKAIVYVLTGHQPTGNNFHCHLLPELLCIHPAVKIWRWFLNIAHFKENDSHTIICASQICSASDRQKHLPGILNTPFLWRSITTVTGWCPHETHANV